VISRQIALLEEQCGGRLFDRTGRGVALTETGQRVRERFPGIQLRIVDAHGVQLSEWLKTGQIDVAILFRYAKETGPDDTPLASVDTFLVGSAKDTLTRSPTVNFASLDGLPLILPAEPNALRRLLHQVSQKKRVSLSIAMECDSLAIQKDVVAAGGGYTILGSHAMVDELRTGRLQASRIVAPTIERTLTLCVSRYRPPTLANLEVAKLVKKCINEMAEALAWRRG